MVRRRIKLSHHNTRELEITDEIRQLGVSRICVVGKNLLVYNARKEPSYCQYDKDDLTKTLNRLKKALVDSHEFDKETIEKFLVLLSRLWLNSETTNREAEDKDKSAYEKARTAEIEAIKTEIDRVKNDNVWITPEEWLIGLVKRYNELQNVVNTNIPEIWPGLEFGLSSLRILNIHECTLPFIGIILGRPSSYKTVVLNLLKPWYCTFYTDSFSPKAWITHTTAVDSEEELMRIDMLPKVKDRHFLTPELAPIFTTEEKDLGLILGAITRIADGHGYGSDSGAHGHREYGDTMFVWTGAAVDIPYKIYKLLAGLGFKIYFFRLPYKEKTEDELLKQMKERFNEKKASIESALYEYLIWFEIGPDLIHDEQSGLRRMRWNDESDDEQALRWIVKLAAVLKHLRCIAKAWDIKDDSQGSNYGYSVTQPESPERAIEVLRNLARGHALLTGRNFITLEDIPIVVKTVLSTANIDKVGLVRLLIANNGKLTTKEIEKSLNVTRTTALRNMVELKVIGLVDLEEEIVSATGRNPQYNKKSITLKKEFNWLLGEEFQKLSEGFEPVDNREFMDEDRHVEAEDPTKGKTTPYTNDNIFSLEQSSTFWRIFDELEDAERHLNPGMEVDKTTISGEKLQDALASSGKFTQSDAAIIIKDMEKTGLIEQVSWNTYRKKIDKNNRTA
jgi:predicted transcriptional regulator